MLVSLRIKNFAIFDDIEIPFRTGLNIITGDTGAGKSIIIDAINLLSGCKASTDYIKSGQDEAHIEGVFDISSPEIKDYLGQFGLETDDDLIIKRIISVSGKNRIFVNGNRITLNVLGSITSRLIDIFGQHENIKILDEQSHISYLDLFGVDPEIKDSVSKAYKNHAKIVRALDDLKKKQSEKNEREEYLKYICKEIEDANLQVTEEDDLNNEKKILINSETLHRVTQQSYATLYEADNSIISNLQNIKNEFERITEIDTNLSEPSDLLEKAILHIQDASYFLRDYIQAVSSNPGKLEQIEERLQLIFEMKRKYGSSIEQVLDKKEGYKNELQNLLNLSNEIDDLENEKTQSLGLLTRLSEELSHKRRNASMKMAARIEQGLTEVGLKDCNFVIKFEDAQITESGMDRVEFYFSANPDEPPKPLSKVASGGELSRIMLILKTILNDRGSQTVLIFDEPDTGIGGAVAESVGAKIRKLSDMYQVLCITHLAQVAKFADSHLIVRKEFVNNSTRIKIAVLDDDNRIDELARMMGGVKITKKTIDAAKEMSRH